MPSPRTCSHIKTNGVKCGSPALRHNTLCYFHYQWERRERRRIRLGGPVGMNKNTGIELPILEGPESIMLAIMEVQRALLDARIDRQMAHTLLYSLQLAIQLKVHSYSGLSDKIHSVATCPELDQELELDRARGLRPAATQCLSCRQKDSCLSPKTCSKLPLRAEVRMEPARLEAVQVEADPAEVPRVEQAFRPASKPALEMPSSRPERAPTRGVEGPAVSTKSTSLSLKTSTLNLVSS